MAVLQHQSHFIHQLTTNVFCISQRGHAPKLTGDNQITVTGFTSGKNKYVAQNFHPIHRPNQLPCLVLLLQLSTVYYQKQDSLRQLLPGQAACTGATCTDHEPSRTSWVNLAFNVTELHHQSIHMQAGKHELMFTIYLWYNTGLVWGLTSMAEPWEKSSNTYSAT